MDSETCELVEQIQALDESSQALINDLLLEMGQAQDQRAMRRAFREGMRQWHQKAGEDLPLILNTYERLERAVPERLAEDVSIVRSFTADLFDVMSEMESVKDFENLGSEIARLGGIEAGQASLRLDQYTRAECDISIAN